MPEPATPVIRPAKAKDIAAVRELLSAAHLPTQGIADQFGEGYAVAEFEGEIVGAIGVEVYGPYGLLRSAVVAPAQQGSGLGKRLTNDRIAWARNRRLEALHLLTTTAAPFFARLGFVETPRAAAPAQLQKSPEFATICGSSAVCMRLDLAK
ncbi:MAG: arsenic resistance N-acetyltransferase ArsN2 [Gemmatimonadales bacterium]